MSINQKYCDRCGEELSKIRRMSWFTTEIICTKCKDREIKIRELLPDGGEYFEGIGFIPINYIIKFHPDAPPSFVNVILDIKVK